ncbi:GDSL-type esterase/lipase family protein [Paenactinomyces guangxiensis]|uniref:SGNH hydrolase-type esterase domain-containing protein n=1 Tax=Paenactinomyces guangxiensis TaxID=1490290 RepID=A0A7W1WSB6_9BACL|nr:GDSL-type esterase/lipase family protein [Paenactinomyces guangxiensis]MBA4494936.1 hypothetical protein [Paenactinomyces guangxiensis]MBH8592019.1 hypothetical protein [Paenactinomyces guangxiensis]
MTRYIICLFGILLCSPAFIPVDEWFSHPDTTPAKKQISIIDQLKQIEKKKGKIEVLVLGDSVALGQGSTKNNKGYDWYIKHFMEKRHFNIQYRNRAISGQRSTGLLHQLQTKRSLKKEVEQADLIFVTIGGNNLLQPLLKSDSLWDVLKQLPAIQAQYEDNMRIILKIVHSRNSKAVVVLTSLYNPLRPTSPHYDKAAWVMRNWNDRLKDVASHYDQAVVVDLEKFLSSHYLADPIHPNDQGYRWIGTQCILALQTEKIPLKKQ